MKHISVRLAAIVLLIGVVGSAAGCRAARARGASATADLAVEGAALAVLEVRVSVSTDDSDLALALFDSDEGWNSAAPTSKIRLRPSSGIATWRVEALPPGRYAVKAYLDLDGDGQLGRAAFGRPTEPFAFSSGARAAFGPPSFEKASFALPAGQITSIEIELR